MPPPLGIGRYSASGARLGPSGPFGVLLHGEQLVCGKFELYAPLQQFVDAVDRMLSEL
jgi:hypothetical protein